MGFFYKFLRILLASIMFRNFKCAICNGSIPVVKGQKKADYIRCECPENPVICGICRHKKETTSKCHWCKEIPFCFLTHKRPNHADEITKPSRQWNLVRTKHPGIEFSITMNFCSFTKFFRQQSLFSKIMRRDSIVKLGAFSPRVLEKFRISFARLVICRFCQTRHSTNIVFHHLISHLRYLLFMAIEQQIRN
jgi:hypothetical protein